MGGLHLFAHSLQYGRESQTTPPKPEKDRKERLHIGIYYRLPDESEVDVVGLADPSILFVRADGTYPLFRKTLFRKL